MIHADMQRLVRVSSPFRLYADGGFVRRLRINFTLWKPKYLQHDEQYLFAAVDQALSGGAQFIWTSASVCLLELKFLRSLEIGDGELPMVILSTLPALSKLELVGQTLRLLGFGIPRSQDIRHKQSGSLIR